MECKVCKGAGKEICAFCFGKGCDRCLDGYVNCWDCQGTGIMDEYGETVQNTNLNMLESQSYTLCECCSGTGLEICIQCYGKGCDFCNNQGVKNCFDCDGKGNTGPFGPTIPYLDDNDDEETIFLLSLGIGIGYIFTRLYARYKFYSNLTSHSSVNGRKLWRHGEKWGEEFAKKHPGYNNYQRWQFQKPIQTNRKRLDIAGWSEHGHNRCVIEVKYVGKLEKCHVDQVCEYARHPWFAKSKAILCRTDTIVDPHIQQIADINNVNIFKEMPSPKNFTRQLDNDSIFLRGKNY